jgi:hypothetical protein
MNYCPKCGAEIHIKQDAGADGEPARYNCPNGHSHELAIERAMVERAACKIHLAKLEWALLSVLPDSRSTIMALFRAPKQ